jgi:hypothetical protein
MIYATQFLMKNEILYHLHDPNVRKSKRVTEGTYSQLVVPKRLREDVILSYHEGMAHLGFDKTHAAIKRKYFWPRMYTDIYAHVETCTQCQKSKRSYVNNKVPLCPIPIALHPFSRIHMDILGPLTTSKNKNKYILVIVDSFSGWCKSFPLASQEAQAIAKVLYEEIICRYGAPDVIVSDRGSNFLSKLVASLCELFQITRHHTSSYHPQSNSTVERVNASIGQALRTFCNKSQDDWDQYLPSIMMAFRNAVSATTGFSPHYVLFGREMRTPLDTALTLNSPKFSTRIP